MHSKIYQITKKELTRDEYLTSSDFDEVNISDFADYTDDIDEDEEEDAMKRLDCTLRGVFTREGRVLTYQGADGFVSDWISGIKSRVAQLNPDTVKNWMEMWKMKQLFEDTHREANERFSYDGSCTDAEPLGDFIREVYINAKPGDKFYIGGIVDFHI